MQSHLKQSEHNIALVKFIDVELADNYFDWRITILFYAALHLLKAWFVFKGIKRETNSHNELFAGLDSSNATSKARLPEKEYSQYYCLYQLSRTARYQSCYQSDNQKALLKYSLIQARSYYNEISKFLQSQGMDIKKDLL